MKNRNYGKNLVKLIALVSLILFPAVIACGQSDKSQTADSSQADENAAAEAENKTDSGNSNEEASEDEETAEEEASEDEETAEEEASEDEETAEEEASEDEVIAEEEASEEEAENTTTENTYYEGDCSTSVGDPYSNPYTPSDGKILAVVGVEYWDILEVHSDPGESPPLVGTLEPLDDSIISLGQARILPQSIWYCIEWQNGTGAWASSYYLSYLADPHPVSNPDRWVDLNAANLEDFLEEVESEYERPAESEGGPMRIVISDLDYINNEVSFDVIGFLDDSVKGLRLTFSTSVEPDGSLTVSSVQSRAMCVRGGGPGSHLCL